VRVSVVIVFVLFVIEIQIWKLNDRDPPSEADISLG